MTRSLLRVGVAGVALVLTASLAGCFGLPGSGGGTAEPDPQPTETAPAVEAGIGVPIRVEQAGGVGELTIHGATWDLDAPGLLPFEPDGDHGYLVLDATWRTLEGTSTAIVNYWMVQDPAGVDGIHFLFVDRVFAEVDLPEGESISGDIAFEISPGPYTFIVYDDEINEVARFSFEAGAREPDGVG